MTGMTIGKKIIVGFAVIMVLLAIVAAVSVQGIRGIVGNAGEVIDGNKLRGIIVQREVDHLTWAEKVNRLLTDKKVTTLDVEVDDHKCGFGKWLYGEGRKEAEALIGDPKFSALLEEVEGPHQCLHSSAIKIRDSFRQADPLLPGILSDRIVDHLSWANKVQTALFEKHASLDVQTNPAKCALGKWMQSPVAQAALASADEGFKIAWEHMVAAHEQLHGTAVTIAANMKFQELAKAIHAEEEALQRMEEDAQKLSAVLERGMEEVLDPAKEAAAATNDLDEFRRWAQIDEEMTEAVTKRFLLAQIEVERMYNKPSEEQWAKCTKSSEELVAGSREWSLLLKNTAMERTGEEVSELIADWDHTLDEFGKAYQASLAARESVGVAEATFDKQTLPCLKRTIGLLKTLKQEAEHELTGMERANGIYVEETQPSLSEFVVSSARSESVLMRIC